VRISDWFARNADWVAHPRAAPSRVNGEQANQPSIADPPGATISHQTGEGGLLALDVQIPILPRDQLQSVPNAEWQAHKPDFIYESFMYRIKAASATAPAPAH
jgi:hypothetical protein